MATVTILELWTAEFPEFKGGKYMKDGQERTMEPRPARTAWLALAKAPDETVNQIELPEGYPCEKIKNGDVLQLTIPDWPEAPFRSRNITRHIAKVKT